MRACHNIYDEILLLVEETLMLGYVFCARISGRELIGVCFLYYILIMIII